jgi:hypothetical protein
MIYDDHDEADLVMGVSLLNETQQFPKQALEVAAWS